MKNKKKIILVSILSALLVIGSIFAIWAGDSGTDEVGNVVKETTDDEAKLDKTDDVTDEGGLTEETDSEDDVSEEQQSEEESSIAENSNEESSDTADSNLNSSNSSSSSSNSSNSNSSSSGSNNSDSSSSGSNNSNSSNLNSSSSSSNNTDSNNTDSNDTDSNNSNTSTHPKSLKETLTSADTLYATTTPLFSIAYPEGMQTVQGGCVYGQYYYQAFIKTDNSGTIIVKYDMEKGEILKTSEILPLNHTNDVTYNSKLGKLVVCNNAPNRKQVSYVNPDTLEFEQTFEISDKIFSINYNEKTNRYVIGLAGGQTFKIVNHNFAAISSVYQPTSRTSGYTTQGCASDDNYIYFVLWKQNVIVVYDWTGGFVTLIDLDISESVEPENISIVNDKIYIGCKQNGKAVLYRVDKLEQ